jgi:quinoprotein glucose dehydrogenase
MSPSMPGRWTARGVLVLIGVCSTAGPHAAAAQTADVDWPAYGHDPGGTRFAPLADINRGNVGALRVAWTYRTGHAAIRTREEPRFETTPLVVDGTLYLTTPLGRVVALDPATGAERWTFDPGSRRDASYGDFASRGLATWLDTATAREAPCRRRLYVATIDARLFAVDAASGTACAGFGERGLVDLRRGLRSPPFEFPAYQVTSPPLVIGDLVITGSAIGDNSRLSPASGEVRAFDARSGRLRWSWDPVPQDPADPAWASWENHSAVLTGAANVWSIMVADPDRGLIFAPTSSPAPDYYGGRRPGSNRYANAVVALRAATGEVAWHFQTVHHDLWDYDNASPPALVTIARDGRRIPAVIQATKTGMLFVLHRETGEPLIPAEERAVPASDVPGERAWPTQPFSAVALSPHRLTPDDAWGTNEADRAACRALIAGLRNEGIFTPPSLRGTLVRPSNIGGAHWGGVAVHPDRQMAVVPVNTIASMVQLIPDDGFDEDSAEADAERRGLGFEYTRMEGTGYVMRRRYLEARPRVFCTPPPWGALVAVDLATGATVWTVPLGTMTPDGAATGAPNLGGPIVTAGDVVFIGATLDRRFRAFDLETGAVLWETQLPAGGRATPVTYRSGGKQYVVIAAGGGDAFGAGDYVVAFTLP